MSTRFPRQNGKQIPQKLGKLASIVFLPRLHSKCYAYKTSSIDSVQFVAVSRLHSFVLLETFI